MGQKFGKSSRTISNLRVITAHQAHKVVNKNQEVDGNIARLKDAAVVAKRGNSAEGRETTGAGFIEKLRSVNRWLMLPVLAIAGTIIYNDVKSGKPETNYYTQSYVSIASTDFQSAELEYQTTATKNKNAEQTGYEVNGVTDAKWWYQTGLKYTSSNSKFSLLYEVWNDKSVSVIPSRGVSGDVSFDGQVNEGDTITIKIGMESGKVHMSAIDLNTKAKAEIGFDAHGSVFVGSPYTGVMTETVSSKDSHQELLIQKYVGPIGVLKSSASHQVTLGKLDFVEVDKTVPHREITSQSLRVREEKTIHPLPNICYVVDGIQYTHNEGTPDVVITATKR